MARYLYSDGSRCSLSIRSRSSHFWYVKLEGTIPISGTPFFRDDAAFQVPFSLCSSNFSKEARQALGLGVCTIGLNKRDSKVFIFVPFASLMV